MKREAKKDKINEHTPKPDKLAAFKRAVSNWKADGRPGGIVVKSVPPKPGSKP